MVFSESLEKTMFEWHHLNSLLLMICENNLSKKNPAKKSSQISRHNHQYFQMIQQRRPKAAEQIYSYFMFTIMNCGNKIWHCELSSLYLFLTYTYLIPVVEKLFQHLHLHLSDGFELEFSGSSEPELKIFRAELGHFNFELKPSWKWADNMHINWEQILDPI